MSEQLKDNAAILLAEMNLVRAADLAACGRYAEAEQLLTDPGASGSALRAKIYHLRARIKAQQGKYREAKELWLSAHGLDPQCPDYRAALQRIDRLEKPLGIFYKSPILARCLLAAGVLLVIFIAWNHSPLTSTAGNQAVQELPKSPVTATVTAAGSDAPLLPIIPGVKEQQHGTERIVHFAAGLFSEGTTLRKGTETTLQRLAASLAPHKDRISLHVVGCADSVPVSKTSSYRDNADLGFRRALKVAEILRASSGIPPESFLIQSVGSNLPSHMNATSGQDAKRTVFLRIVEK